MDTYGMRKTAHVYGALSLEARPRFRFQFADKCNARTFLAFLILLVRHSSRRIFLILDNGPCHNLDRDGKCSLAGNKHQVELFRLPPYSPNLNGIEGGWKETKKHTTHNRLARPRPPCSNCDPVER